jgi:dTDP-4-amino-4,6-dideoxygalactose transaminase
MRIPFNSPLVVGDERHALDPLLKSGFIGSGRQNTGQCEDWLRDKLSTPKAILTSSCSDALEMAVILAGIEPGDEVVMPSFTFPSMANAVVLRGGVPVFVDIRRDTLNIDESLIESAVGPRTKVIMPMHYGGIGCDMDRIMRIANRNGLLVIEDAAQALLSEFKGEPLGRAGHMAAFSFQETKNIHCGEGGALIVNAPELAKRAEIIRDKGTDRAAFLRGEVEKYRWVDIGSSYGPSELQAAWLLPQLLKAETITDARRRIWNTYHEGLEAMEEAGCLRRQIVPDYCRHNAHVYYLIMRSSTEREKLMEHLHHSGIGATFHFVPLHDAPAGRRFGRVAGTMAVTDDLSSRLLRLPLWLGVDDYQKEILAAIGEFFTSRPQAERSHDNTLQCQN